MGHTVSSSTRIKQSHMYLEADQCQSNSNNHIIIEENIMDVDPLSRPNYFWDLKAHSC